ncbi:hypothetical protein QLQ12_28730 [Actinoplanes sp. NEAU-A12]|uniref:Permease n=1 Tax=Actinoplanes sandaracinus TaxID=3045177 RepID=A0ABT6WSD8_9ACTN|nr:hypothetical protein [Actinoplanes sandaracinus]MDI6102614.1 hypothetical protein [Actinoplanes sandaracinus]
MTTSYPCPQCGATASLPNGCPACGAGPDTDAAEVIRLDGEIADLRRQLEEARARVSGLDRRIQDAHSRRSHLAARVVARRAQALHAPTTAPAAALPASTASTAGTALPGSTALTAGIAAPAAVTVAEPRLSTLTVQNVLFILGGLLLVVAAAVFTAVAWAQVGVTGRALLLAGATAAILAVPPFAARRGLTAAAETLTAVGLLMILLDGYAAWAVDFLFVQALHPSAYAAAVLTFTAVTALAYSWPTKLHGPRIAALLMAQPVFPLLADAADAGPTGWSLAFSAIAVLDLAALRVRPARFTQDGTGILAYVCATLASAVAATIAFAGLVPATTPRTAAEAGASLLLPPLIVLVWALLARLPRIQATGAALLVVALGIAGARWAWTLPIDIQGSEWPGSRIALVALVLAAAGAFLRRLPSSAATPARTAGPRASDPAEGSPGNPLAPDDDAATAANGGAGRGPAGARGDLLQRWLPSSVRSGAWVGALIVAAVPAITVVLAAAAGAILSVGAAGRVWATPMGATVTGLEPDMLAATVLTAVAYALLLPRRTHADLGLTALAVLGFLVPAAFGLPWWTAAVAGIAVAAVALLLAARSPVLPDALYRIAVCLIVATHAVVTGCGQAAVAATVCGTIALLGLGTAGALRNAPRGADVGAGSLIAGLLAVPAAMWLALFAADVPVTTRVRVSLGFVVLLCAVAHAVTRRLPGYGPYALGVALATAGTTPLWAAAGDDPVVLYAAAGLLLVVASLPIPAARTGSGAVAGVLPALALFALIAGDLAVVVLEPWSAVDDIWSGVPPRQSPVAWSSVVALAAAAVAAAAAGWLLALSTRDSASSPATASPAHPGGPDAPSATSAPPMRPAANGPSSDTTKNGPVSPAAPTAAATRPAATEPPDITTPPGSAASGALDGTTPTGSAASDSLDGVAPSGPALAAVPPALVAVWAAAPLVALAVPMVFAAAGATWPAVPIAALATGLAGLLAVTFTTARHMASGLLAVLFGVLAAAGTAGSAAGHGATIAAFSLVLAASATAGFAGRRQSDRTAGWAVAATSTVVLAYTIADLTHLGIGAPPLFVLGAAALAIALEAALESGRPAEARAPFAVGHASAVIALLITDSLGWAALVCKLWALVLAVRAMRPGEARRTRFRYALASGSIALAGWWFLLSSRDVETTEIYTLPAAALAVVAGWFARRARPDLPSWTAYGAALAAAFLPTLAVIADSTAGEPHYPRRLLLGVGALLVLLAGARARLQAPVVTGGGTLLLVALHELIQFWDLVPRWMPLAVGGLLLVGIATTMEQRRRDLARLRAAVGRMI